MTTEEKSTSAPTIGLSPVAFVLIALALLVYSAALCVNPARANDLFWQLRTGQLIAVQHIIPHQDTYSWTRTGTSWVAHEWLAFALFWICYAKLGFGGIWLMTVAITMAIMVVFYALVLKETSRASVSGGKGAPATALLLTAFAAVVAGAFFQPRPHLFTYLFCLLTLAVLMKVRRESASAVGQDAKRRSERALWLLFPVFVLWANLHAGVIIGLGLLAAFAIGDAAVEFVRARGGLEPAGYPWRAAALSTSACFVATLMTPYGIQEYQNFAATVSNSTVLDVVAEWASPNFHDAFGKLFEAYALLIVAAAFLTKLRHDPTELAVTVVLVHEALIGSRNVPIFVFLGTVLMGRHIQSSLIRLLNGNRLPEENGLVVLPPDSLFGPSPSIIVAMALFVVLGMAAMLRTAETLKQAAPAEGSTINRLALASIQYGDYPSAAVDFIERERFPTKMRMYNTYDDGGFLIWRMPERPVFADSRADVYFGPNFAEVRKVTQGTLAWRDVMDQHGVDFIVSPVSEAQSRGYLAAPDWALVYVDSPDIDKHKSTYESNNTFIFVRRTAEYAPLISRCRHDCPELAHMQSYSQYLSLR